MLVHLGWVDFDLGVPPSCPAGPSRIGQILEHSKCNPGARADGTPSNLVVSSLMLTGVLLQVAEEHHNEANGEEVDGEERRQRPAGQPPRAEQFPGGGQHGVVVVVNVCGMGMDVAYTVRKVHRSFDGLCNVGAADDPLSNVPSFEIFAMNGI